MCLQELNSIIQQLEIFCQDFEVNIAFNFSMMSQINETTSDRIFNMSFVEFLEAIARLSDQLPFFPLIYSLQQLQSIDDFSKPLSMKLDAFCKLMTSKILFNNHQGNQIISLSSVDEQ
eukprot:TRINITY_DN38890_c0_g3_i1.p4 TRINITY_DN38890_c0_g3~~TRINITY_DN38890_c0_g3_i1.p4  ORF type:complete len:118 (-),score=17.89 TRINITY_DN38890_c0_g3_i1:140-493(-)